MRYKCLLLDHDDTVVNSTATIHYPAFLEALRLLRPGVTISLEDFSTDTVTSTGSKNRPYVPIDIDNAKEIIGEKVIETLDKTKEKLEHFNVSEKIDKAKEIIGEMTSANAEPVYTEMDMSAVPADKKEETASVSATYTEASGTENSSEEFFNDSESK